MTIKQTGTTLTKDSKTKDKAAFINHHVGQRLRLRRSLLGITQEKLSATLDVSFQQIQKYERGKNRLSAGNLYLSAHALRVPVGYFYTGLGTSSLGEPGIRLNNPQTALENDLLANPDTLKLVRLYNQMDNADQTAVITLMGSMANKSG